MLESKLNLTEEDIHLFLLGPWVLLRGQAWNRDTVGAGAPLSSEGSGVVADDLSLSDDLAEAEPNEYFGDNAAGDGELFDGHVEEASADKSDGVRQAAAGTSDEGGWVEWWAHLGDDILTVVGPDLSAKVQSLLVGADEEGIGVLHGRVSSSYGGKHVCRCDRVELICKFDLRL